MSRVHRELSQAIMLDRQGRFAEAAAVYRKVLATEPGNGEVLSRLGIVLARMGHTGDAVGALAAAVRSQPRNPAMQANLGNALSTLGRHADAVMCYERALALKPDLAAAHHGLGLALLRIGRFEDAASSLGHAAELAPNDSGAHADLGVALERIDRKHDAIRCFRRAVELNPNHADAHHNLGLVRAVLGESAAALVSLDRALALQPTRPAIQGDRGNVLLALGRPAEALACYDFAISREPREAGLHHNRGMALMALARYEEAVTSFEAASVLAPRLFDAHFHRGVALLQLDRLAECLSSFDLALGLRPHSAEIYNNRGVVLARLSRPEEALECFSQAVLRNPDHAESYTNAGNTLKGLRRYREALQHFDRALSIRPDEPMTIWSKALLKLALGEFRDGWPLYEARFRLAHLIPLQRHLDIPRWSGGESIEGATLLVYAEQGIGDTLLFCRFIPLLEARGAKVLFEVQPVLKRLLGSLAMRGTLIGRGESIGRPDRICPLLSLPLALGTEIGAVPGGAPYLNAESAAVQRWNSQLSVLAGLRVGLNWQGNSQTETQPWLRGRSFALREAAPLARVPGVSLVSLQKGEGSDQRDHVDFKAKLAQLTDPLDMGADEFADTAALVKSLDLIITSDTAMAHLAGALGAPVWVVLQFEADWRWFIERDDSPWYPTMRLFRQRRPGDWAEVFERVAQALRTQVLARASPT